MTSLKKQDYIKLIEERKKCKFCAPTLTNPSCSEHPEYDCDEIGLWSRWQNSLNADIIMVGQDWAGFEYYKNNRGLEKNSTPTNDHLVELFTCVMGIPITGPETREGDDRLFFTNAILCLKPGNMSSNVPIRYAKTCCSKFLRPLIDLIEPKVVIALGTYAYQSVAAAYDIPVKRFKEAVECKEGFQIPSLNNTQLFPVYHCGASGWNINRKSEMQFKDWTRIKDYLDRNKD